MQLTGSLVTASNIALSVLKGGKMEEERLILEGYLYNSASKYLVIAQDDGKSVELNDTLMRSRFLCMKIRVTIELIEDA